MEPHQCATQLPVVTEDGLGRDGSTPGGQPNTQGDWSETPTVEDRTLRSAATSATLRSELDTPEGLYTPGGTRRRMLYTPSPYTPGGRPKLKVARQVFALHVEEGYIHPVAYGIFYLLLFFANWFGAKRFDFDDDGDFDAQDVQMFLEQNSLLRDFFRTKKKKTRSQMTEDSKGKTKATAKAKATAKEESQAKTVDPANSSGARSGGFIAGMLDMEDMDMQLEELGLARETSGEVVQEDMIMHQTFPAYIVGQTIVALLFWLIGTVYVSVRDDRFDDLFNRKAGIDTCSDGWSDLRLTDGKCGDLRGEVWRYFTYQWTHVGITHVAMNTFMNLVLGIPLEGVHGHLRMFLMYNLGVMGGACCYWVGDAHKSVVGMSAGCYSLIGMHVSNILMNWHQMKFRWLTLIFVALLITLEMTVYFTTLSSEDSSHTAHLGGFLAGALVSTVLGENLVVHFWERIVQAIAVGVALLLGLGCIIHLILHEAPKNLFEAYGWCYLRQVYDLNRFGNTYQCVQCANKGCIEEFMNAGPSVEVMTVAINECVSFFFEGKIHGT